MQFREYLLEDDWNEYEQTLTHLIETFNHGQLDEGLIDRLSSKMKNGIAFIKKFSEIVNSSLLEMLKLFKDKIIFSFFSKIKWNIKNLLKLVKKGYKLWDELHNVIAQYVADNEIVKWTKDKLEKLDEFLDKHSVIKRVGSLVVVGFLIYQWTQMISFTGDIEFDFDQSLLFAAISGNFSLADLFATADGVKMLLFIATGVLTGISFPWPGNAWVLFAMSIVYTIAKKNHPAIAKTIIKNVKKYKSFTTIKI